MASYFLYAGYVSRTKVTAHAACRGSGRVRSRRTRQIKDCTPRDDVVHQEIVLPPDLAARADMAWARDRATLWKIAGLHEKLWGAPLARSWLMRLPPQLTAVERRELAVGFAPELARRYRCAVDVCIQRVRSAGGGELHQVHMLMTLRELTPAGLGQHTALELRPEERQQRGLTRTGQQEHRECRALWAGMTRAALARAGVAHNLPHRALPEQGIQREPSAAIPRKVPRLERGVAGAAADAILARHLERLAAIRKAPGAYAQLLARQRQQKPREVLQLRQPQAQEPKNLSYCALTPAQPDKATKPAAAYRHADRAVAQWHLRALMRRRAKDCP